MRFTLLVLVASIACERDNGTRVGSRKKPAASSLRPVALRRVDVSPKLENHPGKPGVDQWSGQHFPIAIDDFPMLGAKDALVTVVVAGEYACPFCKRLNESVLTPLLNEYPTEVRVVHLPRVVHPLAKDASLAVCAANRQGAYEKMSARVWRDWYPSRGTGEPAFEATAESLGIDVELFRKDVDGFCSDQFERAVRLMETHNVRGTPTSFINGHRVDGAKPYLRFEYEVLRALEIAYKRLDHGGKRAQYYRDWVVNRSSP